MDVDMSEWRLLKPPELKKYVNKEVRVTAEEKQQHQGWVHTVDPVSYSIVLVSFLENGRTSVSVVMGHAVEKVDILQEGDQETTARVASVFLPQKAKSFSVEELQHRKESLRRWLEKNRIPVEVQGDTLRVANVLTVGAPYGTENCTSPNEIILARVQSLVENNPDMEQVMDSRDEEPGAVMAL